MKHALAIKGQIPAPAHEFTVGDIAEIYVKYNLDEELSLHWHGIMLTNEQGQQKIHWEKLRAPIRADAVHIKRNKDLAHQREHFIKLSNSMYSLVSSFKANEAEAYLLYCPMKKPSWLSDSEEVKNPYYGNRMLKCTPVTATLKKAGE